MKKTRTRILSLTLTLVMLLGLLPGVALAEEAVEISTPEQFASMEQGGNYKLTDDITIATPYGDSSKAFQGTFDGNGHTITLDIDATATYQAAFAKCEDATIKNLVVKGEIKTTLGYAAGITAHITGGRIENCGGEVTITCSGNNSTNFGGITGYANGTTITGCYSTSAISGKIKNVGGIAGQLQSNGCTVENCYNLGNITSTGTSAVRAGGIVGNGNKGSSIKNCYTAGTIHNDVQSGAFAGYLTSDFTIENCYYLETAHEKACGFVYGSDTSGIASKTGEDLTALASTLGAAYKEQADGYPILSWQGSTIPVQKDPHIEITGSSPLYMTNSGAQPTATLKANYVDMDDTPPVTWSLESGEGVVELVKPDNAGDSNASVIVKALKSGVATVKATAGEYADEVELTVWPFVTTVELKTAVAVELDGQETTVELSGAAAGHVARVRINIPGGEELDYDTFPITGQWKYLSAADYNAGNTGSSFYRDIPGATGLEYTVPREREGDYLSFTFRYQNEDKIPSRPSKIRSAEDATHEAAQIVQREQTAQSLQAALASYVLRPAWGEDTNIARMLEDYLADHDLPGFTAAVKTVEEVYGGAGIAENGDLTYFYTDPNTTPAIRMGSYKVTFTLTKGEATAEQELPVIVYWDVDKVREVMGEEILSKVALDTSAPVATDLSLPKVVDGKRWALISWQSSDPAVIAISGKNQTTADTLFDPYVGVVTPGEREQKVTLTAAFTFQLTNDAIGGEAPIVLYKTFDLTVPALEEIQAEAIRQELLAKLDRGFDAKGLTDAVTGERLAPGANGVYTAIHDIQLPTTRDFGVDGKEYPVTITSSDQTAVHAPDVRNAARVEVLRPGVGQVDGESVITVTIADRDTSVTASRAFPIQVRALTQEEVDGELALMERVKAAYFDGIKGENAAKDDIRTDLVPFQEVYEDENSQLVWVRTNQDKVGHGIVPTPIEGWEDLELWRLFQSSNPNVVSHEDLRVTRQSQAKAVTVTSYLSSETLGRYGALYQSDPVRYAQYAALEGLYYQRVTTGEAAATQGEAALLSMPDTMVVRGTSDPDSSLPVTETLDVSFVLTGLDGQVWIAATTYTELDESSTVYDLFARALTDNGYTAVREKGTYLVAVSGAQGSLTEKEYGSRSGWMYRVNGVVPQVYMGGCPLHGGDRVQVFYTRDASVDDPDWIWPSDQDTPTRPSHSSSSSRPAAKPVGNAGQESQSNQPQTPASQLFSDVAAGSWYESGVTFVVSRGLFQGVADGRFAPEIHLTRAMLMTVLARLDGRDTSGGQVWYQAGLDWAVENGISDGTAPDASITREQLAVMLYRYAKTQDLPTAGRDSLNGFADREQVSTWARDAVAWAVDQGIITGNGGGLLDPQGQATRAEAAAMLQRFCKDRG